MPTLQTKYFGHLEYQHESVYDFAAGIPGFEKEKQFLFVDQPLTKPLIFMQSLEQPELCFLGLPIRSIDPGYRLHISEEDLLSLELSPDRQPEIGADVLCLALISLAENQPPTANLLAPIVVNLKSRRAAQAIQADTDYSHQHPLGCGIEAAPCS
jgi:flagellar assembly factor FliW